MPTTKTTSKAKADQPADEPKARRPKTDAQGHLLDAPDYIPARDDYDSAKHANHSHFEPA